VVGRSGAGKTTLTLLLLGLIEPEAGQITVDGIAIARYQREALWGHIGYVPQEPVLFHGSARENIAVGRSIEVSDIVGASVHVGTHDRLAAIAEGYDADLGENGPFAALRTHAAELLMMLGTGIVMLVEGPVQPQADRSTASGELSLQQT
jgi:ABC-type multidrug transport system fused ATPase/permease subunit